MFGFFKKPPEPEFTEPTVDPEDVDRTTWIEQKAQVGAMFAERLDDPTEDQAKQREHYETVRDELIEIFDGIEDEYCRGFASYQLIKMCWPANDLALCRVLLAGVRDKFLREEILRGFPELSPSTRDWRDGR